MALKFESGTVDLLTIDQLKSTKCRTESRFFSRCWMLQPRLDEECSLILDLRSSLHASSSVSTQLVTRTAIWLSDCVAIGKMSVWTKGYDDAS
jgi:hypothetical protein